MKMGLVVSGGVVGMEGLLGSANSGARRGAP